MTAGKNQSRNCHVIWAYVPCFWALKETVLAYNLPFRFHCHCINALELTKGADTKCPLGLGTWKKKIVLKRFCKINSRTLLSLFAVWTFTVRQFSVTYSAVQVTDNNRMCSLFDVKACRVSFFYCKEWYIVLVVSVTQLSLFYCKFSQFFPGQSWIKFDFIQMWLATWRLGPRNEFLGENCIRYNDVFTPFSAVCHFSLGI